MEQAAPDSDELMLTVVIEEEAVVVAVALAVKEWRSALLQLWLVLRLPLHDFGRDNVSLALVVGPVVAVGRLNEQAESAAEGDTVEVARVSDGDAESELEFVPPRLSILQYAGHTPPPALHPV